MSKTSQDTFTLRHPSVVALAFGLLFTLIGMWPIILVDVPDRIDTFAAVCTGLALPGVVAAMVMAQSLQVGSRIIMFLGNLFFYSALAGLFVWWRRRRVR